jgi:hypothetical protein|tara:strand:+ start:543 stop:659 length:117 start_codon:yes stop_codon:yes gene_type:complete
MEQILNNLLGLLFLIGAGWFAWESSMIVDEMKRKRRKK